MGDEKINQSQFFDLITGKELSWQSIIYDLIKTDQLDPWDIDIGVLADKYLEVIQQLEEANFFISSKVLLACSLMLRLKSEMLLNKHIQEINDALYGRKEDKKESILERIEIDEDELPLLIPYTPLPRFRRVTLKELMSALNNAIETESRRIKKEIRIKQGERISSSLLPKFDKIPLKDRIMEIYLRIKNHLDNPEIVRMEYSKLAPTKAEKLSAFMPILHLASDEKISVEQDGHFQEIYMVLGKVDNL